VFFASVLLLSGLPASAAPPSNGLSLDGLLATALEKNRDLNAARAQVEAAMARLRQAGAWPNPRLQLSHETDAAFAREGEYVASAGFAQDFPIAGRLARAQDVSRVDVARALTEVNTAERDLIASVASAYADLLVLDQKIALLDQLIAIDGALVGATSARYKAGEVSQLDVNAAELELERVQDERAARLGERTAALRTLGGLAGLPASDDIAIDTTLPPLEDLPPLAELTDDALARRPDLHLLQLDADRAGAERALAAASAWEDWTVSLGFRQDRIAVTGAPPQPTSRAAMLSLTIPLPLFNQNEGAQAAASAQERAARERFAALTTRIENDVRGQYEQATRLAAVLRTYRDKSLPLSRRNAELARSAYRGGQVSILEVVQTERLQRELAASYTEALAQYFRALEALKNAAVQRSNLLTKPVAAPDQTETP